MNDSIQTLELRIARLLRLGVFAAAFFITIGWLGTTDFDGADIFSQFHEYHSIPLQEQLHEAWTTRSWMRLTSYFGLAVLISLPVLRVLLTVVLFLRQKEKAMAGIALFVLSALTLSFALGLLE